MTGVRYQLFESLFNDLLLSVANVFSEQEISEVKSFIDHAEYGLALETFVDIAMEEEKILTKYSIDKCEYLAKEMGIFPEFDFTNLTNKP